MSSILSSPASVSTPERVEGDTSVGPLSSNSHSVPTASAEGVVAEAPVVSAAAAAALGIPRAREASTAPPNVSVRPNMQRPPSAGSSTGKGMGKAKLRTDDGRLARGRKSRARIRQAARELFREKGFDGATLRAIATRAGMGASSIYRHVQSKEELLIDELAEMQEEAWTRFRASDDRNRPTRDRLLAFFDAQHDLLVADRDLTTIALRATTKTEARVAKRVLQLYDRTIGLLMEILQRGRMKRHLAKDVDVLETARVLFHVTNGARIPWANGMVDDESLRSSVHQAVDLLFRGVSADSR